jgi:hypothetical protein
MLRPRIVIELGPAVPAEAALRAAASLAARAGAELLGLFVEDPELLRFAALPIAHEIGLASALRRPLDAAVVERALRAQALEAERRLAAAAAAAAARWSFRVARAQAKAALLGAAIEAFGETLPEELRLLLFGEAQSVLERWAQEARAQLAAQAAAVRAEVVRARSLDELAAACAAAPAVLVLAPQEAIVRLDELLARLETAGAPVLLLPGEPALRRRY